MQLDEAMQKLGVQSLRGKQAQAIEAVMSGVDVLYVFPTGTGKTFVFECCAVMSEGATVVVSPLRGLLQQQGDRLASNGVGVLEAYDGKVFRHGNSPIKIVYTTPEQLAQESQLRKYLHTEDLAIDRLVVDEAHVVLQWQTFRCVVVGATTK